MPDQIKPSYDLTPQELADAGAAADAVRCFRLLTLVSQRLRTQLDQRLREDGLTVQQGFLLSLVRSAGEPSLGEIARAMGTSHQNAKQVALAAERNGFVKIVPDAEDSRVKRVVATMRGQRGWVDRNRGDFAAIGEWLSGLTASEQRKLIALLVKLARTTPDSRPPGRPHRP